MSSPHLSSNETASITLIDRHKAIGPSPQELYQQAVASGQVNDDASQQSTLIALQMLFQRLQNDPTHLDTPPSQFLGLYIWGKVGRGKTFLMDTFVKSIGTGKCLRQHFHHFMQDIHGRLTQLEGVKDPLKQIARELAEQYKVLCFDEFFVNDIGDAMLLGRLMMFIFEENMQVVATSNTEPQALYKDGLQRDSFIPAIKAIEKNLQIIHMAGPQDHRERPLDAVKNYFLTSESNDFGLQEIAKEFSLKLQDMNHYGMLDILGREIIYLDRQGQKIAFDFQALCMGPRSHFDYIEIAKQFNTVIVSNVPCLGGDAVERIKARGTEDGSVGSGSTGQRQVLLAPMDDGARRFIALVDEFYDQKVRLYVACDVPLDELYTQGSLSFQFERTRSRLIEMGSRQYMDLTLSVSNSPVL